MGKVKEVNFSLTQIASKLIYKKQYSDIISMQKRSWQLLLGEKNGPPLGYSTQRLGSMQRINFIYFYKILAVITSKMVC